jgi:phosphohistidine swiveling domain-containing protein
VRLIALDEPAACEPSTAGVKAAWLARARQRGSPVLPGVVLPVDASSRAIEVGTRALERAGVGAARRVVDAEPLDQAVRDALTDALPFSGPFIVRSSTALDHSGLFAGAFASVADVRPEELATAVRGCWASIFAPGALRRLLGAAVPLDGIGMAVLIQPSIRPDAGGWARIHDGAVEVVSVDGSPAPLFAGAVRGARRFVGLDGSVTLPDSDRGPGGAELAQAVASLLHGLVTELGADRMEWAKVGDSLVVLQIQPASGSPAPASRPPTRPARPSDALTGTAYRRFARTMLGRTGRLGELLIAPWAAAGPHRVQGVEVDGSPAELLDAARRWAAQLSASLASQSGIPTSTILERLFQEDSTVDPAVSRVSLDPNAVAGLIGSIEAIGAGLVARRLLDDTGQIWWQDASWIDTAVTSATARPPAAWIAGRWADLVFRIVARNGVPGPGMPASDGQASGRAVVVTGPAAAAAVRARDILVVDDPRPDLAPLLWTVAAVVSRDGDPAAHLFEVARSRRIPAVAAIGQAPMATGDAIAVDGDAGATWTWPDAAP